MSTPEEDSSVGSKALSVAEEDTGSEFIAEEDTGSQAGSVTGGEESDEGEATVVEPPKQVRTIQDIEQMVRASGIPLPGQATKAKKAKKQAVPKDSMGFYRGRHKEVKKFGYTKDGNLQVPEINGQPAKVIELPFYKPASIDELREAEEKQLNDLAVKEEEYNTLLKQLREAINSWRETKIADPVVKLQKDLRRLDAERTFLRSPMIWMKTFSGLDKKQIDFSNMSEQKKLGYNVRALRTSPFTWDEMIKSSNRPFQEEVKEETETPGTSGTVKEESFIVFFDPADSEHGFLSPDTLVEFVFRGTKYFAPIQAYERERVKELGRDMDIGAMIKKQKSIRAIRKMASMLVGQPKDPRDLWIEVIQAVVAQHPRFLDQLKGTGSDILVYADPTDDFAGVGLPAEDENITDRSHWTGKNLLGEAWMAVRQQAEGADASEGAEGSQAGGSMDMVLEDATLAHKQEITRKGVLIANYRRKVNFS